MVAKTDASMKRRNGESRMITANEPRCGGPSGAYAPPRGMKCHAIAKPAEASTSVPSQRRFQWLPIRSKPPIGGPIVTPRLDATRTAA